MFIKLSKATLLAIALVASSMNAMSQSGMTVSADKPMVIDAAVTSNRYQLYEGPSYNW